KGVGGGFACAEQAWFWAMRIRARGFTLAELVIVIVIATILAAIAIPQINFREIDASWFHEQVRSGVRYAQRTAVAQRRCVFVSVSGAQLSLFYGNASCAITGTAVRDLATDQPFVLNGPTGVSLSAAPNPFSFNGLGQPSAAAVVTVSGKTVTVNAEGGYVQ
ncbi:MAG: prepilin-type N-terminal cleavage/methylation domain-containing protein, partial [Burkholderiales bacterium]